MSGFDRDKHLKFLVAGGLILFVLCVLWGYRSYQRSLTRLESKISAAHREIETMNGLVQEYRQAAVRLQGLNPAQQGPNLIASVENAAQKAGARGLLLYVRPQPDKVNEDIVEEGVEIRLEKLDLQQLVELLYDFETSSSQLNVKQLRIRTRFDNPEQLDTVIVLSRLRERT